MNLHLYTAFQFSSFQFSRSVMSDSLWPHGLQHTRPPCPSQLWELAQPHVRWVSDAIQPSHPLSSPSPLTFNLSQRQGLFRWVSSSHHVAKGLEFQLQHQSFQWTLLLLNPIGFGLSCFHFHSFLCIFWFLLISFVISWLFSSMLFSIHMFVFL